MTQQPVPEFDARVEMKAFVERARAPIPDWHVGVTADPDARLEIHGVTSSDWYIVRRLTDAEKARKVAQSLLELGCSGSADPVAGEEGAPTAVYVYWKRGHTTP